MFKKILFVVAVAGFVTGCAKETDSPAAGAKEAATDYQNALESANVARKKAMQSDNEWTGAHALMESAAQLAADGKLEAAAALLDEARLQFELAVAQVEREGEDWSKRVVR